MGIPGLFSHYYRKFKKEKELFASLKDLVNKVDYLFFDYNSLIHPAAYQILLAKEDYYLSILDENKRTDVIESDIIQNCINYTQLIINIIKINPKKVFIMIDGVAPRSKMNQQRERRYKSHFFRELEPDKIVLWDSNKITPGTEFMEMLTKELHLHFPNTLISDSNEPGEGEHKMMKYITECITEQSNITIYGLDADLIMLSLLNKQSDNIILIRDSEFGDIENINYLNIAQLKGLIFNDFKYKHKYETSRDYTGNVNQFIDDYILLCFLLGNDFLDHLFCLYIKENSIDVILKAYIKASNNNNTFLVNKLVNKDNWRNWLNLKYLKDIFYQLKNYEEYYLKQQCNKPKKNIKGITLEQINNSNNNDSNDSNDSNHSNLYFYHDNFNNNNNNTNYNNENFKKEFVNFYNIQDTQDVCFNYIEGLYWILGYYNNHIHNNWTWYYNYHNVPFCNDLFNYLNKNKNNLDIDLISNEPSSSFKQLSLVLPKKSFINIIKNTIKNDTPNSLLYNDDIFTKKLYIDINYKEFLWQSKILFNNNINENIIELFEP